MLVNPIQNIYRNPFVSLSQSLSKRLTKSISSRYPCDYLMITFSFFLRTADFFIDLSASSSSRGTMHPDGCCTKTFFDTSGTEGVEVTEESLGFLINFLSYFVTSSSSYNI